MHSLRIPNGAHILVGDGRKALFLVNQGTVPEPDFKVETAFEQKNPPTREQGTDGPGRLFASHDNRRGGPEPTDWQA